MNILVTGGYGLIGHKVCQTLINDQHTVSVIDNQNNYGVIPQTELDYLVSERTKKLGLHTYYNYSITKSDAVDSIMNLSAPDTVVHLASYPRQKAVNANPTKAADVMCGGLVNLLESASRAKIKRFVYISSSMVYGNFQNNVTEDAPCNPQGQYGILKLAGEWLVKDYAKKHNFEYVIIRPSAVYGPLDVEDRVVAKFMLTAMRGGVLPVKGAAETLDFTYVDDAAAGIVAAATRIMARNNTYNITKSHSVSLLEAAERIVSLVGKGTIECQDRDVDFPSRGALNIDRARTILGYDPKVDVDEGFQRYFDWLSTSEYWNDKL